MKVCTRCGREREEEQFPQEGSHWCKSCFREYHKEYRKKNYENLRENYRKYYYENKVKILNKAKRKKYWRGYYAKNKKKMIDHIIASQKKFPEKHIARYFAAIAVKNGWIKKEPCKICGEKKVQMHHKDYSRPFMITWLCGKHHYKLRSKYK